MLTLFAPLRGEQRWQPLSTRWDITQVLSNSCKRNYVETEEDHYKLALPFSGLWPTKQPRRSQSHRMGTLRLQPAVLTSVPLAAGMVLWGSGFCSRAVHTPRGESPPPFLGVLFPRDDPG